MFWIIHKVSTSQNIHEILGWVPELLLKNHAIQSTGRLLPLSQDHPDHQMTLQMYKHFINHTASHDCSVLREGLNSVG